MKRPLGLILAVLALGFIAAFSLLAAAGLAFTAATALGHGLPLPVNPAAPPPPSAHVLAIILGATAVVLLLFTALSVATIAGLLRLRNWARYSILTMGGLLAFFGLSSVASLALLPSILAASQPPGAALPPGLMHGIFLFIGLFYGAIAAVGAWWLVYFNLRSVKAFFLPGYRDQTPYPPPQRQSAASLATPGGLASESYPPPYAMPAYVPPPPGRLAHIPTSIIVIAILFFFATLTCAGIALLPFPAFLLGFVFTGAIAPRLLYLVYAVATLFIGVNLLRLRNTGRLGVYLFSALGFLNLLITQIPWGKARYAAYNAMVQAQMHASGRGALQPGFEQAILLFAILLTVIFYAVQIWLIERHRALFK